MSSRVRRQRARRVSCAGRGRGAPAARDELTQTTDHHLRLRLRALIRAVLSAFSAAPVPSTRSCRRTASSPAAATLISDSLAGIGPCILYIFNS